MPEEQAEVKPKTVVYTSGLPSMPRPNNLYIEFEPPVVLDVGGRNVTKPGLAAEFKKCRFATSDPKLIAYLNESPYYGVKFCRVADSKKFQQPARAVTTQEFTDKPPPPATVLSAVGAPQSPLRRMKVQLNQPPPPPPPVVPAGFDAGGAAPEGEKPPPEAPAPPPSEGPKEAAAPEAEAPAAEENAPPAAPKGPGGETEEQKPA